MKVGDLVALAKQCRQSGRIAVVVKVYPWGECDIAYQDGLTESKALNKNLVLLCEGKKK